MANPNREVLLTIKMFQLMTDEKAVAEISFASPSNSGNDQASELAALRPQDAPAKRSLRFLAALACITSLMLGISTSLNAASTNKSQEIVFVHLVVRSNSVALVKAEKTAGFLKVKPAQECVGNLSLDLLSQSGAPVWGSVVANPLVRHFDYEDPAGSGELLRKTIILDEAEITIRMPVVKGARRLELHALENPDPKGGPPDKLRKRSLGKIELPSEVTSD
jgi:hypothetical protein